MEDGTLPQDWVDEVVPGDAWRRPDAEWDLAVLLDLVESMTPTLALDERALFAIHRMVAPETIRELLFVQVDAQGALRRPEGHPATTDLLAWVVSCLWGSSPSAQLLDEGCSLVRVRGEGVDAVAHVCIPLEPQGRIRTLLACSITTHSREQVRRLATRLTLLTSMLRPVVRDGEDSVADALAAAPSSRALTQRQQAILEGMAEGLTNRQIAARICFSESTVRLESMAIYRHFGVHSRGQAVAAALASGVLKESPLSLGA